jgi:hypothetical protein
MWRRAPRGRLEHPLDEVARVVAGGDLLSGARELLARGGYGGRVRKPRKRLGPHELVHRRQLAQLHA